MDTTTKQLASFASSLEFCDVDPAVIHAVKQRFIDTIGCALGGFSEEPAVIARRIAASVQSSPSAGVIGVGGKSSLDLSAFANATMIRCLDFNDDYFGKDGPHPSDTIAAVLAAADSMHADGRSFITGVIVAYEILCSLVDAVGLRDRGWDYVTFTAPSAALGAAKVLGLSQEMMSHCVSLAVVPNGASGETRLGELSMWKGLASANACRNAIFACMLAREGATGPSTSIEGKAGLWSQITGPFEMPSLGTHPLKAGTVYLKSWPVFYSGQLPVQVALALREKVATDDIESITVESYKRLIGRGATDPEKWTPKSRETADHSVPFCVAAVLLDGKIDIHTFESKRFLDSNVVDLMSKVELREDPEFTKQYPEVWNCRITATTNTGGQHQVHARYPKGHPNNPMTDKEVEEKFLNLSEPLLGPERCRTFLDFAWHLEDVDDIGRIFELLAI